MERARRVGSYLISKGVDAKRVMMAGYADTDPIDGTDSEDARAKNRRVEIFIEPTAGAAAQQ
jgi:flagellar motor protein MotB